MTGKAARCDGLQDWKGARSRLTASLGPRRPNLPAQIRGAGHFDGWDGGGLPVSVSRGRRRRRQGQHHHLLDRIYDVCSHSPNQQCPSNHAGRVERNWQSDQLAREGEGTGRGRCAGGPKGELGGLVVTWRRDEAESAWMVGVRSRESCWASACLLGSEDCFPWPCPLRDYSAHRPGLEDAAKQEGVARG